MKNQHKQVLMALLFLGLMFLIDFLYYPIGRLTPLGYVADGLMIEHDGFHNIPAFVHKSVIPLGLTFVIYSVIITIIAVIMKKSKLTCSILISNIVIFSYIRVILFYTITYAYWYTDIYNISTNSQNYGYTAYEMFINYLFNLHDYAFPATYMILFFMICVYVFRNRRDFIPLKKLNPADT